MTDPKNAHSQFRESAVGDTDHFGAQDEMHQSREIEQLASQRERDPKLRNDALGGVLHLHDQGVRGISTSARTTCAVLVVLAFGPQLAAQLGLNAFANPLQCRALGRVAPGASLSPIPTG
jgi:hypothetical protein